MKVQSICDGGAQLRANTLVGTRRCTVIDSRAESSYTKILVLDHNTQLEVIAVVYWLPLGVAYT